MLIPAARRQSRRTAFPRALFRAALASSVALFAVAAQAQDAAAPASGDSSSLDLEEIIVTGTARAEGIRKLDASFAITSIDPEDIAQTAPKSTADLFKLTPGVWVESSGGESGANVFVRGFPTAGDAEFTTVQLNSSPIFPPSTLSFLENSTLFRLDETIERVEGLRGGPNPVFSNGQPGVTFNFIEKKGGKDPEGLIKLTGSDYGTKRLDVVYGGPISEDWFVSVGGFYRETDGIRDTEFPSDRGGQFSANVTHVMDNGEVNFYGRRTKDKNAWLLPIPLIAEADGGIREFPGFDAGTGTYHSNDIRLATLEVTRGSGAGGPGTIRRDLSDGRGIDLYLTGGSVELDLGNDWEFSGRYNYLAGDANTMGVVPVAPPVTAAAYLANRLAGANGDAAVVGAAGGPATTGSFTFAGSGAALTDLNQQVMELGWWSVEKELESFTTDLRLSKTFGSNTVTVGVYIADYSSKDLWYLGNNQLVTAESNSRRLDLALNNGVRASRGGFVGAPFFDVNASYNGQNIAGVLADEWQVTDTLRIDGGLRLEKATVDATLENVTFGVDLDDNPLTLHNNGAAILNGTFREIDYDKTELSWTVGANLALTDEMGVFARVNHGVKFPQFDNLRDGATNIQEVDQYELGYKADIGYAAVFATAFYNDFKGLPFQRFVNGQNVVDIGTSRAYGVEVELVVEPVENLQLALTGTFQDAEFKKLFSGGQDRSGNQISRQPPVSVRFTPSYEVPLAWGSVRFFGTVTYVDDRFSDPENLQVLPSYTKYDAGFAVDVGENLTFQIVGDNLTDKLALTEGNPRVIGSGVSDGVVLARPILGRSVEASVSYRF
ncbi:MAG TPA: TonB-dependent receptor [Azospirillaceae bacterium]|nr:TonB-dependent receptor [Azospirillaceae bacterium]